MTKNFKAIKLCIKQKMTKNSKAIKFRVSEIEIKFPKRRASVLSVCPLFDICNKSLICPSVSYPLQISIPASKQEILS